MLSLVAALDEIAFALDNLGALGVNLTSSYVTGTGAGNLISIFSYVRFLLKTILRNISLYWRSNISADMG